MLKRIKDLLAPHPPTWLHHPACAAWHCKRVVGGDCTSDKDGAREEAACFQPEGGWEVVDIGGGRGDLA
eukprot:1359038-Rhodomonas_salina.1